MTLMDRILKMMTLKMREVKTYNSGRPWYVQVITSVGLVADSKANSHQRMRHFYCAVKVPLSVLQSA